MSRLEQILRVQPLENRTAPAGDFGFALALGSAGRDDASDVATDTAGNVIVVGRFAGTVDFDPGPGTVSLTNANTSPFVAKYATDGTLAWARAVGESSVLNSAPSVAIDTGGNAYVTGNFSGTADFDPGPNQFLLQSDGHQSGFVLKLDPAGEFLWAGAITGANADVTPTGIAVDGAGGVHSTGFFTGAPDFDPSAGSAPIDAGTAFWGYVLKLDTGGAFTWAKAFRTNNFIYPQDIAVDANGIYTTGLFKGGVDFDPAVTNFQLISESPSGDDFVSKLNLDGTFGWAKRVGSIFSPYAWGSGIAVDAAGNVFTTGVFIGTHDFDPGPGVTTLTSQAPPAGGDPSSDMFVSKFDSTGQFVWAKRIGGRGDEWGVDITTDAVGNLYTTGLFSGSVDFDEGPSAATLTTSAGRENAFVAKLDTDGYYRWARQLGRGGDAAGLAIAVANNGAVYSAGRFDGTGDFDPGSKTVLRTGKTDAFVSKLSQKSPAPLTYASPVGNGTDSLLLRRRGEQLELINARTGSIIASRHSDEVTAVSITGAADETDILTIDYSAGRFQPPGGTTFHGGAGGLDSLRVRGADTDYVLTDTDLTGGIVVKIDHTGIEGAELTGGAGDNILDASAFTGGAVLTGLGGNDQLLAALGGGGARGGPGIDTVIATGDANFTIRSLPLGRSELKITAATSTLHVMSGVEQAVLTGGDSNNILDAAKFRGPVILAGGLGNDVLIGGSAADNLNGGDGDDSITGGRGSDQIDGGGGTDTLIETDDSHFTLSDTQLAANSLGGASRGADALVSIDQAWLTGGAGANKLNAALFSGRVSLDGGAGKDVLTGGSNADHLIGGDGLDSVTGGVGADEFSALDLASEYLDFNAGEGDTVV